MVISYDIMFFLCYMAIWWMMIIIWIYNDRHMTKNTVKNVILDVIEFPSFQKYIICWVVCPIWRYDHYMTTWWSAYELVMITIWQKWQSRIWYLMSLNPLLLKKNIAYVESFVLYDDLTIWWSQYDNMMITYEDIMMMTQCQDHILKEKIWSVWSNTS